MESKEKKLAIGSFIRNLVGYFWAGKDNWEQETQPIKYVVGQNGVFEVREDEIAQYVTIPKKIQGVNVTFKEDVNLKLPKIPYEKYQQALAFLRAVYKKDATEATIHVFWNREEQGYFLWVPKQKNAGTASDYERDNDPEFTELCNQHLWVMAIHSHPGFAGKPSGIDDRDEKRQMLYMVVGNIMSQQQTTTVRTCVNGEYIVLPFEKVWELQSYHFDVPQEWIDKCEKRVYVAPTYATRAYQGTYLDNSGGYEGSGYFANYGGKTTQKARDIYDEMDHTGSYDPWENGLGYMNYLNGFGKHPSDDETVEPEDGDATGEELGDALDKRLKNAQQKKDDEYFADIKKKYEASKRQLPYRPIDKSGKPARNKTNFTKIGKD